MKKNLVPLLGIAFVVAIVSTGIFYGLFVGRLKTASAPAPSIVVAARNLDRGASLQSADVKLTAWGGAAIPEGALTSWSGSDGRGPLAPSLFCSPVVDRGSTTHVQRTDGAGMTLAGRRQKIISIPTSGMTSARNPSSLRGRMASAKPISRSRQRFTRAPTERS